MRGQCMIIPVKCRDCWRLVHENNEAEDTLPTICLRRRTRLATGRESRSQGRAGLRHAHLHLAERESCGEKTVTRLPHAGRPHPDSAVDQPILCSRYREPNQLWLYDTKTGLPSPALADGPAGLQGCELFQQLGL